MENMSGIDWRLATQLHDVIVVGCGAAGIAAMSRLILEGFDVIGLEASDRIGGRIHSVKIKGGKIDLGAEWCHGESDNVVYDLAKEYLGRPEEFTVTFINSKGVYVKNEVANDFVSLYYKVHMMAAEEMIDSKESLGYHCNRAYWNYVKENHPQSNGKVNRQLNAFFQSFENSVNASDTWHEASARGHLEYHDCEGEILLHWKGKGYEKILEILQRKHFNSNESLKLNINYGKEVAVIDYNSDNGTGVKIQCEDGSQYFAKHVILTVSLGVLQERQSAMFSPKLPQAKINCINGLNLGTVNKMFLVFEKPWWSSKQTWYGLLWTQKDKKKFEPSWLHEVFAFNTCEHNPRVLCGWVVGAAARYMETLEEDVVIRDLHKLVQHFFGKIFNVTFPKKLHRSTWYSNKLFRGSYSFRSMKSEAVGAWSKDLAIPLRDYLDAPVLCFAGEASSEHYFSSVHGAIESGFREAERLITFRKANRICRVVVVGAGISGIMAARQLAKAGIRDCFVLEAEDRIGGRIHSVNVDGEYLEYGASWLHGVDNELRDISEQHNLLSDVESVEGEGKFYSDTGLEYDPDFVKIVTNVSFNMLSRCEKFKNNPNVKFSVGEFMRQCGDCFISENIHDEQQIQMWRDLSKWYSKFQEIDNSCNTLYDLSARCWGLYDFNGETNQRHINYKKGYVSLLDKIVNIFDKDSIHLCTKVERIDWMRNDMEHVVVHTKNNRYICDHVIVTTSLGVLKNTYTTLFNPRLPLEHETAIKHMGFSGFAKIFLQFEEAWWEADDKGFQFVWPTGVQTRLLRKLIRRDALWVRCITGFDVVSIGPPNCLIGWVTAAGAKVMETLSEHKVMTDCMYLLRTFLRRDDLPHIKLMKRTTWMSNPSFSGCYSHLSVDCDMFDVGPSTLAVPVTNSNGCPAILFAGEATHEKYFSTTHGAAETGVRQANVIINYINERM